MIIQITDSLNMETELPIKYITRFQYSWEMDYHAVLYVDGYVDQNISCDFRQFYNSKLRIYLIKSKEQQNIFWGIIVYIMIKREGKLEYITLKVLSASYLLDQKLSNCSYQNVQKTYGEIVREAVEIEGGRIIRNRDLDKIIETPVIRYQETVWQFAKKLSSILEICIIPDIVTGRPNFWFGMRKGKEIPCLFEDQYMVDVFPIAKGNKISYQIESNMPLKLGDYVIYLKQKLTIIEVKGYYERGELIFKYKLGKVAVEGKKQCKKFGMAGLGLWGIVKEVKGESLKVALDIDNNRETGNYFYPWQPETGNSLYSMPEKGAKVLLYFYDENQRNGAVIHCLNQKVMNDSYKKRTLLLSNGNQICLWEDKLSLSKSERQKISVTNNNISLKTKKEMKLIAGSTVFLRGKKIMVSAPEELIINQA